MHMDTSTLTAVIGAATGVVSVAIAVGALVARPLRKLSRDNDTFREDWYGQPARAGVDARAGVMERLANIEKATADRTLALKVDALERRFDDHLRSASQPLG
jgi:hypothetical protein